MQDMYNTNEAIRDLDASIAANSPIDAENYESILCTNLETLEQLYGALDGLSDTVYVYQSNPSTSSIGMHTRHILEFYQELIKTLTNDESNILCYDNRQRNMLLEASKDCAMMEVKHIQDALIKLSDETDTDKDLTLCLTVTPSEPLVSVSTSMKRELFHVLDHMIHHMAVIKLLAQNQDISLSHHFGLAKSTQDYQDSQIKQAPSPT